jgi:hypothetical protein
MKTILAIILLQSIMTSGLLAQYTSTKNKQNQEIYALVDSYSLARETRDTVLLKKILMSNMDQLVSTGEWRIGIESAISGMLQSSAGNPGSRTLRVETVRFLDAQCAIADAKYEIKNADSSIRKMWSTFVVVLHQGVWKISAIRNMLPAENK